MFVLVIAVAVLLVGLAHLWRQRRRQTALLRRVLDALMREEGLAGANVLARVRVPFWRRSPATVLITGLALDPEARATALHVARTAAASVQRDAAVHDGILLDGRHRAAG